MATGMKILAFTALMLIQSACARPSEYTREELERKQAGFRKMRTSGIVMGVGGGGMVVLGAVLMGTAKYETREVNGQEKRVTFDPQWPVGFISMVAGVPVCIAGIVLGSVGSRKVEQYQNLLGSLSLEVDPLQRKLSVAYSF